MTDHDDRPNAGAGPLAEEQEHAALLHALEDLERSRQQIEHSRQEWTAIFDAVSDPIFLHDAHFRVLRANRAYIKRAGKPLNEIVGQPYWKIFPLSDGPLPQCLKALQAGEDEGEEEISCEAGEICTSRSFILRNEQGVYQSSIHIIRNITVQKRVQMELHESEEKFRKISAAAADAILMMDNAGKVTFWNAAAERIFGYTAAEALDRELHGLIVPPRFYDTFMARFPDFQSSGQGPIIGKTRELQGLRKDGAEIPVELTVSSVQLHNQWHAIGIVRDITERKLVEAQVVAQYEHVASINTRLVETNRKLEQAQNQLLQSEKMASIGQLAAGVAHEINNPIGYVNSNLGTLKKYLADIFALLTRYEEAEALMQGHGRELEALRQFKKKVDLCYLREDIKALLTESQQGLERVKKIVIDLKDFSRPGADEQWTWADIHQGLESTLSVVWNELKYKCEVKKEYGVLPQIYCLPSQLNQVFMNLLVNAAQAIEVRGEITIRTGRENGQVWVEIADTGSGIAPENLTRIFDPFFTTKPVGKGTGLGLSVSHGIVEKHHGRIEVQSEAGKGSVFRVWLPVGQPMSFDL